MVKILIVEDDINDRNSLDYLLRSFLSSRQIEYEIDFLNDDKEILKISFVYDFIFLDMEVNSKSGIEIGKEIRKSNAHSHIIITSSFQKYLIEGYAINADRYFLKPIQQSHFNMEMENIFNRYFHNDLGIMDPKLSKSKIYFKDVLYIDFSNRKSFIKLENGKDIETPYTLSYWEEKLQDNYFCKCNRYFLVNLLKVDSMNRTEVFLENGNILDLSRKYRESFEKKWIESVQNTI
ncbi:MAG: LytTR family DNA-binding domain-containing protein [Bacillota bacterium]|nr:LytTR family DNA-binding domain-containing protein [Bacillota bacterium]